MNELHKAYQSLGLEPGNAFDTIKRRYRRLALVWHPDRMSSADAKREAEEELKKINNNFEKLKKHFESEHKSGPSCRCQPAAAGPPPNSSQNRSANQNNNSGHSSGPSEAERKKQEEETSRKRTAEREKKEAEQEAARRAAQAAQSAQQKQHAANEAIKNEALRKDEVLRWKCTLVVAVTFFALIGYCWIGCAARDLVHWTGKQWDEFQSQFKPKQETPAAIPSYAPQEPSQPYEPYIPPYEKFPGGNPMSWRQFHDEQEQRRKADEDKQRQQDIYFAKLQIDRAQKTIDHCNHNIAQMELKLTEPFISDFEKNKIREMRDFQLNNLQIAQSELRDAQNKLKMLDDNWPFGPPQPPPKAT
ncbi:MAG: J domain-containing protein [Candidatus Obscuribacterales bacterium]|nr:J domain-containing protein [Candidatus Obscuribacterales bacterium]